MKTICFIQHHLKISLQGFSTMSQKPTILFWVVAIVSLLWNLLGCWNYIIQQDPLVVANMSEVYQFIIENRPTWATAAFAVSVFGGAVGSILLLLRRKTATGLFTLSLLGSTAITYFYIPCHWTRSSHSFSIYNGFRYASVLKNFRKARVDKLIKCAPKLGRVYLFQVRPTIICPVYYLFPIG